MNLKRSQEILAKQQLDDENTMMRTNLVGGFNPSEKYESQLG